MSQEKVERYKAEKANRKEILKKQKRNSLIVKTIMSVIGLVLVVWIGYSAYGVVVSAIPRVSTEIDTSSLDNYLSALTTADETDEGTDNTDESDDVNDETQGGENSDGTSDDDNTKDEE